MRCLRKLDFGKEGMRLSELPIPKPKKGQVLVKVKRAGICGTDIHIYHDEYEKVRMPVTLGHEISGIVAEVDTNAPSWKVGEKVVVESEAWACGECHLCKAGRTNLCQERLALGSSVDGSFADYVVVRESALHKFPDNITFSEGALSEPLAVAVHAVIDIGTINPGSEILIIGPGIVGLLIVQVCKLHKSKVFLAGISKDKNRLELARNFHVDAVINSDMESITDTISRVTENGKVDVVFECSGNDKAFNDALQCVKPGGTIIQVGLFGKAIRSTLDLSVTKEIIIKGSFAHIHKSWIESLDLLKRSQVDVKPLISSEYSIDEWEKAFQTVKNGEALKVLFNFDEQKIS
jgi:L-iditol 2-dehydrogenase